MHIQKGKLFTITNGSTKHPTILTGIVTNARHIKQTNDSLRLTIYHDNEPMEILESKVNNLIHHLQTKYKLTVYSLKHET